MYPKQPSDRIPPRPSALERRLHDRIRAHGPLSFGAFMDAALYTPRLGYYACRRSPWGAGGDYVTAPQTGSALGAALARLVVEVGRALPAAATFDLVEFGSGDGELMASLLAQLQRLDRALYGRTRAVCVERSATARRAISDRVPSPPGGLQVVGALRERRPAIPFTGVVFSNEFLDALPVERVCRRGGRLLQSRVESAAGRLVERFGEPVDPRVQGHLADNLIDLREGQVGEVCLGVAEWLEQVAASLEAGAVVTVDYGHETAALYGETRPEGTLVGQRRYCLVDEPLAAVGQQDLTAHVDFGNLRRLGASHALERGDVCSLGVFLIGMGLADLEFAMRDSDRERMALRHMLVSEIAQAHRVMLLTRGAELRALSFGRQRLGQPAARPC